MSDTSYGVFQHYGTNAQRLAFVPAPPASGQPIYIWYETDTGNTYLYHTSWVQLGGAGSIPNDSVTNAMLSNMAESTIKGRAVGAGTGDPTDLTALQTNAILSTIVVKSADETVNNSAVLQADDELLFAIGTSGFWEFEFKLWIESTTAADFKVAIIGPAAVTGYYTAYRNTTGDPTDGNFASSASTNFSAPSGFACQMSAAGSFALVMVKGVVRSGGTAGNVVLHWAQNAANAVDTTVKEDSLLVAIRRA